MKRRSMPMCASPEPASSKVRRKRSSLSRSSARLSGWASAGSTDRILAGIADDSIPGGAAMASYNYPVAPTACKKSLSTLPARGYARRVTRAGGKGPSPWPCVRQAVARCRASAWRRSRRARTQAAPSTEPRSPSVALQVVLQHRRLVADRARDVAAARSMRRAADVHAVRGGDRRRLGPHPDGKRLELRVLGDAGGRGLGEQAQARAAEVLDELRPHRLPDVLRRRRRHAARLERAPQFLHHRRITVVRISDYEHVVPRHEVAHDSGLHDLVRRIDDAADHALSWN